MRLLNLFEKKRLEKRGLYQIRQHISELEDFLTAYEKIEKHFMSPEWIWLTTTFLPAEQRRVEHARSYIPPDEVIKHAMIQGQINEIEIICNQLEDVKVKINEVRESLKLAREVEAKLVKQEPKGE